MADYSRLLDAAIAHLEGLQRDGVRAVAVDPSVLAALSGRTASVAKRIEPGASAAVDPLARPPRETKPAPLDRPSAVEPMAIPAPAAPPAAALARWAAVAQKTSPSWANRPLPPALSAADKMAAFAALRAEALACVKCPKLVASRQNVVFGVGDPNSPLMFIGEAPGADEDRLGEPFVGKAGELLTRIIGAMGLSRSQVYIANILKCRPDTPGQTSGNRKPTPEEMAVCQPWLERQIDLIQPKVIVALGSTAVEGLIGKAHSAITRTRGQWLAYRSVAVMPTYHPAYLLRNQAPSEKRKVWEDMLSVMERLEMPISDKQRAFFLVKPA